MTPPTAAPDPRGILALDAFGILSHCHEHVLQKLTVLEGVAHELQQDGTFDDSRLARLCDVLVMMDTAIPLHSADEEETLFTLLRQRPPFAGVHGTPMDCMESEHVGHRRLLAELKRAIMLRDATATSRAARSIVAEYREHIAKEEEILYPMARQALGDDTAAIERMTGEMRDRRVRAGLLRC